MDIYLVLTLMGGAGVWIAVLIASLKKRIVVAVIVALLIIQTYIIKPMLSCAGYYIIYSGCDAKGGVYLIFYTPIIMLGVFMFSALLSKKQNNMLQPDRNEMNFFSFGQALIIFALGLVAAYTWVNFDNFEDFTNSRLESAKESGVLSWMKTLVLTYIIILKPRGNVVYQILVGIFSFLITGQKTYLLLPLLLHLTYGGIQMSENKKLFGLITILLIASQILRSYHNVTDENIKELILWGASVPFDAFDNGIKIINDLYSSRSVYEFLIPLNLYYTIESIVSIIPRVIWDSKPEIMGFWLVQKNFLPELFTGTDQMSVSTSLSADMFFSFGLFFMIPVLFLTSKLICKNYGSKWYDKILLINVLLFLIEFSRGGFRSISTFIISLLAMLCIYFVLKTISYALFIPRQALK